MNELPPLLKLNPHSFHVLVVVFQCGLDGCHGKGADVGSHLALQLSHGFDHVRLGDGEADTPPGHRKRLGEAVHNNRTFSNFFGVGEKALGLLSVVEQAVVDLVGNDEKTGLHGDFHQGVQLFRTVGYTGWVAG